MKIAVKTLRDAGCSNGLVALAQSISIGGLIDARELAAAATPAPEAPTAPDIDPFQIAVARHFAADDIAQRLLDAAAFERWQVGEGKRWRGYFNQYDAMDKATRRAEWLRLRRAAWAAFVDALEAM
jgi:hypothetical protein